MWKEQYDRMLRGVSRLQNYYDGISGYKSYSPDNFSEFKDTVLHLFQDIYHLRDWLIKDPNVDVPDDEIYALFHVSQTTPRRHLPLARDIANGSKHLVVTRPSITADAKLESVGHITWNVGSEMEDSVIRHSINIDLGGTTFVDALLLALDCLHDWDSFLGSKGLL